MQASLPRRASENHSNPTHNCPLCNCTAGSRDDIYCHLLVSHRKSAITDALLDGTECKQ
ncbi:MAG: hypothetical protein ABEH86_01180 [Haloarcula sp.]